MYSLTLDKRCPNCGEKVQLTENLIYDYFCPECKTYLHPWECYDSMETLSEDIHNQEILDKNL